ncbi:MAG: isoprenyl synthetase [Saprospiraceae bacterium]|nr:MAG: isoprenyl synthetase [Saprospiraceae bacterium]
MQKLQEFQGIFEKYLSENSFERPPGELYQPVDYILSLGGKRLRPVLVLTGCHLFHDEVTPALPAAMAIEVFHNFSLVHDDIMDAAPLRRGQPTVHTRFDTNTAILSGDVMLIYTYDYLCQLKDRQKIGQIISVFNKVAIKVCEGQQYDMNFEKQADVSIPDYLKMIELKTAVLIAGSLKIGAMIGGAGQEDAEHLWEFGRNIGIAFQLQDDYLDTFGDPEKFGKKIGGDIAQHKKTFLILKALEVATPEVRHKLQTYLALPESEEQLKIQKVTAILTALNLPQLIKEKRDAYRQEAYQHLSEVSIPEEAKQILYEMSEMLIQREV